MPIVIGKSVNFLLKKFTPKAGQIYPVLRTSELDKCTDITDLPITDITGLSQLSVFIRYINNAPVV